MKKFTTLPNTINQAARNSPIDLIEHIIHRLENEAIAILIDAEICDETYYNPPFPTDSDAWRAFWVNEAHHQCDDFDPVGSAGEHLDQAQRAAVNVLVSASALRESLEHGTPSEAAALAMILVSDAVIGGLSIDLADASEKLAESANAKRVSYELGIGKRQAEFDKMKIACIEFANSKWGMETDISIGNMADAALENLRKTAGGNKSPGDMPGVDTIRGWLRAAGKDGMIKIPEAASKAGRPRKTQ